MQQERVPSAAPVADLRSASSQLLLQDFADLEPRLMELKRKLLQEEIPVSVISGPGGCGKTTLAALFCQDPDVQGKYRENIFFFTVSGVLKLEEIVGRLFQQRGCTVPDEFRSEEDLLNQLENLLKWIGARCPILLVLDDVWSELEELVGKLNFGINNYQILVTSRYNFARFGFTYDLEMPEGYAVPLNLHFAARLPDQHAMNTYDLEKTEEYAVPVDLHFETRLPDQHAMNMHISADRAIVLINIVLETLVQPFAQLSSPDKPQYALAVMILSLAQMIACFAEFFYKGKKQKVKLRMQGLRVWFDLPSSNEKPCYNFFDYASIVGSVCQFILGGFGYSYMRRGQESPIKVSLTSFLLLVFQAVSIYCQDPREIRGLPVTLPLKDRLYSQPKRRIRHRNVNKRKLKWVTHED